MWFSKSFYVKCQCQTPADPLCCMICEECRCDPYGFTHKSLTISNINYLPFICLYSLRFTKYNGNPMIQTNRQTKNQPQGPWLLTPWICPFFTPIALASIRTQILVAITTIHMKPPIAYLSFMYVICNVLRFNLSTWKPDPRTDPKLTLPSFSTSI